MAIVMSTLYSLTDLFVSSELQLRVADETYGDARLAPNRSQTCTIAMSEDQVEFPF